jgi:hypothetical protein
MYDFNNFYFFLVPKTSLFHSFGLSASALPSPLPIAVTEGTFEADLSDYDGVVSDDTSFDDDYVEIVTDSSVDVSEAVDDVVADNFYLSDTDVSNDFEIETDNEVGTEIEVDTEINSEIETDNEADTEVETDTDIDTDVADGSVIYSDISETLNNINSAISTYNEQQLLTAVSDDDVVDYTPYFERVNILLSIIVFFSVFKWAENRFRTIVHNFTRR